jgi:hypothetical protein
VNLSISVIFFADFLVKNLQAKNEYEFVIAIIKVCEKALAKSKNNCTTQLGKAS